jgi:hypothetical protein
VGKGRQAREADNLIAICEPIVQKMWEPRRLSTLWAFMACYRDSFTFLHEHLCSIISYIIILTAEVLAWANLSCR